MTDEVSPAPAQLICGKGDCLRAERMREALKQLLKASTQNEVLYSTFVGQVCLEALDPDQ